MQPCFPESVRKKTKTKTKTKTQQRASAPRLPYLSAVVQYQEKQLPHSLILGIHNYWAQEYFYKYPPTPIPPTTQILTLESTESAEIVTA